MKISLSFFLYLFGISNFKCIFVEQYDKRHGFNLPNHFKTPITIAVMYAWHCIKQNSKRFQNIEEAKPYQFERDEIIPEFDEFTQMLVQRRMYKGRADK